MALSISCCVRRPSRVSAHPREPRVAATGQGTGVSRKGWIARACVVRSRANLVLW